MGLIGLAMHKWYETAERSEATGMHLMLAKLVDALEWPEQCSAGSTHQVTAMQKNLPPQQIGYLLKRKVFFLTRID
ncbi:hypothetical protein [Paenibacillus sp. JJ-100]|uniref:hypothetical protein n=1 Tax=Paenibacillus sp. JJ-100 TaxID=2974896 RepID=UPI00232C4C10|nr:hypothetical protein [Paenibacillus sp. JJ-100]